MRKAWQYQNKIVYWEYGNRKKKVNKKDSKGNTISILGKPSANQTKTKKATKEQRTTKREKAKS